MDSRFVLDGPAQRAFSLLDSGRRFQVSAISMRGRGKRIAQTKHAFGAEIASLRILCSGLLIMCVLISGCAVQPQESCAEIIVRGRIDAEDLVLTHQLRDHELDYLYDQFDRALAADRSGNARLCAEIVAHAMTYIIELQASRPGS